MDRNEINDAPKADAREGSATGSGTESWIHGLLGMTPEQVEADIVSRGKTAAGVLKRFGTMEREAAAKFFRHPARGGKSSGPPPRGDYRLDVSRSAHFANAGTARDWLSVIVVDITVDDEDAEFLGWGHEAMSVFLDTRTPPVDGDIVLASIQGEGEALRRFVRLGLDAVSLEPLGDKFQPADAGHPSQMVIHGVVIGKASPV